MSRRKVDKTGHPLKKRPEAHSRSGEHRATRARPRPGDFAKILASMPNVGLDSDFERVESTEPSAQMFD